MKTNAQLSMNDVIAKFVADANSARLGEVVKALILAAAEAARVAITKDDGGNADGRVPAAAALPLFRGIIVTLTSAQIDSIALRDQVSVNNTNSAKQWVDQWRY